MAKKSLINYLEEIKNNVEILGSQFHKVFDGDLLFAYRGESKDYPTNLVPSLFRGDNLEGKEMYLFELFSDYNLILDIKNDIGKAIETQHYAGISRMLDITFDVLVSIFFACKNNANDDGYLYVFGFPEYFSPHSSYVNEVYSDVMRGDDGVSYFRNFKVISHSYSNERIMAQKGGFILFPGIDYHPLNSVYYKKVLISSQDKKIVLSDLDTLFQINEAVLFPEKEKIANVIKKKFITDDYVMKDLTVEQEVRACFKRIDYEIMLTEDENPINKKRLLRKEKNDLLFYVASCKCTEKEMVNLELMINSFFEIATLTIGRI